MTKRTYQTSPPFVRVPAPGNPRPDANPPRWKWGEKPKKDRFGRGK